MTQQEYVVENLMGLPPHMREGMARWVLFGIKPGSFMSAVIANDLMRAIERADHINITCMRSYAHFLFNEAPPGSHGSEEVFKTWKGTQQ